MKTISLLLTSLTRVLLPGLASLLSLTTLGAAPQDVDLTGANPNPDFEYFFNLGVVLPGGTTFGVLNSTGNVFWEFASVPAGATGVTSTTFTKNGITVTIPNSSAASVPNTATAVLSGTPTTPGAWAFTVTVADENDATRTRNRQYVVDVRNDIDLVLVLDRSGSMGIPVMAGGTRWDALKDAVDAITPVYADLNQPSNRIGLTYFASAPIQPSAARFPTPLISVTSGVTPNTVHDDLASQSPSGSTAMGAGMKDAQSKLSDATRVRIMLVVTDGAQNVNPKANSNGRGYSDATPLNASYPAGPGSIKVFTIGIDGPAGPDLTTLQNLANENRGAYTATDDGTIDNAFTEQLVNAFHDLSPQLVERSTTSVTGAGSFTLQTFPLNKNVSKLFIQLKANRRFEVPELAQWLARIRVEKDGANVTNRAKPSWVSNYTNTVTLVFDFKNPPSGAPPITPEGSWAVKMADVTNLKVSSCKVTTLADDHRLDFSFDHGNAVPRVNTALKPSVTLSWLDKPITNASVQAIVLRPGEDLGDLLANNPLSVNATADPDAGSPGQQKFDQLWNTDSSFRKALALQENVVNLTHSGNGKYEGAFNGLNVAGNYRIVYRFAGDSPETGKFQRFAVEGVYVSFNQINLEASNLSTTIAGGTMTLQFKPKTPYGKLVGPAFGNGFTVDNPNVKIDKVVDHQDGSYTITFSGAINEKVSLQLAGQEVYNGKLSAIGKGSSFLDKVQSWLESLGLPGWFIWIILLLLALLIWFLRRLFKK